MSQVRDEASAFVAELEANLRHASVALRASLHGGGAGALALAARNFLFRGSPHISRLLSARNTPAPYSLTSSLGGDGGLRLQLRLRSAAAAAAADANANATTATTATATAAATAAVKAREATEGVPPLLEASLHDASVALLVGPHEVLRVQLRRLSPHAPLPPPPVLSPLPVGFGGAPPAAAGGTPTTEAANGEGGSTVGTASVENAPKRRAAGPPPSPPRTPTPLRRMEVFENQRRLTLLREYSAADLLPIDTGPWSDEAGNVAYRAPEQVALPAGDAHSASWQWVGDWRIDLDRSGLDDHGWQFAINWGTGWLGTSNPLCHVRRRRWLRTYEPIADASLPRISVPASALASPIASPIASPLASPRPSSQVAAGRAGLVVPLDIDAQLDEAARNDGGNAAEAASVGGGGTDGGSGVGGGSSGEAEGGGGGGGGGSGGGGGEAEGGDVGLDSLVSAAALFQVGTADGVCVQLSVGEAKASGALRPLVDHLAAVLRGESPLGVQPWMQPVLLAVEGTRKHLLSEHLRADLALTLRADTESEEGNELTVHLAGPTSLFDEPGQPAACCFTFKHEINLLDFVEDLADLFSALTTKLAAQTPYVSIVP